MRTHRRPTARRAPIARDAAGRVWTHPNVLHLYRWLAHRNALLAVLAAAPTRRPAA